MTRTPNVRSAAMPTNRARAASTEKSFRIEPAEEVRSGSRPADRAAVAAGARSLAAPPVRGRKKLAQAASGNGGTAPETSADTEGLDVYRLSELPQDVTAAVTVAQALG